MKMMSKLAVALLAVAALVAGGQAAAQETLNVWWVRGFYKSEDDALYAAIKKFETKTGVKVELSQYPVQDMIPKTVAALDAGTPPDVAYADVYDFQVDRQVGVRRQARGHHRRLDPMKDTFLPNTIETTYLYNDKAKKNAYYAFPLKQQTMHVQYWIDMLGASRLQGIRHPDRLEGLLGLLVRQGAARVSQEDRERGLRDRASRWA